MINREFYNGYEGEGQVIFRDESKNELVIWEGYIYILMERMFDQEFKVLSEFFSRDDDINAWLISDLPNALAQFRAFDFQKMQQDNFAKRLPQLVAEITRFLLNALNSDQRVYIEKD